MGICDLIVYITLAYYYHIEWFANTNHELENNKTKITKRRYIYQDGYQNGFGKISIKSTSKELHSWNFKILNNKPSVYDGLMIGIMEDGALGINNHSKFTAQQTGYALCSNGDIYSVNS